MIVDVLVVLLVGALAYGGYRAGLMQSVSSLLGLVAGLAAAIPLAVTVGRRIETAHWRIGVVVAIVVLVSNVGYVLGHLIGRWIRRRIATRRVHLADRLIGALASVPLSLLLIWMLAVPLGNSQIPAIASAVRSSTILPLLDEAMPDSARTLYKAIDEVITAQGLPDVVGPLDTTEVAEAKQPDPGLPSTEPILAAAPSVVKIAGKSTKCARAIDGSGFVFAPERVMTNAHVVAGTTSVSVKTQQGTRKAHVVYIDDNVDVAVLHVPGLAQAPLPLATARAKVGADAVVAGYPRGGDYEASAATIRASGQVTGPNFRDTHTISRDVYVLRAVVVPGNSGGPLLDTSGQVIGVVFASSADKPEVGYALTLEQVSSALESGAVRTNAVSTGSCYR